MEIAELKAFVAVAEAGSFSMAANHLHLTQPAVSKRISQLEDSVGCQLRRYCQHFWISRSTRQSTPRVCTLHYFVDALGAATV